LLFDGILPIKNKAEEYEWRVMFEMGHNMKNQRILSLD
jgi:hypothetical protein